MTEVTIFFGNPVLKNGVITGNSNAKRSSDSMLKGKNIMAVGNR